MIEVVNHQRKWNVDIERWETFVSKALLVLPASAFGASVSFVSDRTMSKLNWRWRGKRGTTDVLSFRAEQNEFEVLEGATLGELVISVDQAARQAVENNLRLDEEIAQLILHGLIHLTGFDHATDDGEMNRLELRMRRKLGI